MSRKWRTYSVFVSSTFADMQSERDYLQTHVFPLINEELRTYAISLRVIDLRFGINTLDTDEETVEEKVLRVCLDEIKRSKPFFLGLLGNRYGTIPSADELSKLDVCYQDHSITAIEINYGFLQRGDIHGCLFMERDNSCYGLMTDEVRLVYDDSVNRENHIQWCHLQQMKAKIKKHLDIHNKSNSYQEYSPQWDGTKMTGLEEFGEIVKDAIVREVVSHFQVSHSDEPFADENIAQEEFLHLHRERLFKREKLVDHLTDSIHHNKGLLTITGESGIGKSCVYTMLVDYCNNIDDFITLYHATDTGQDNRNITNMLSRWIYILESQLGRSHKKVEGYDELSTYFRQLIKSIPDGKKLVLLIDGIEGFYPSSTSTYLTFFPKSINEQWILCCTCTPDIAEKIILYHKSMVRFEMPHLTRNEAEGIISVTTKYEDKELYKQNICSLLEKRNNTGFCYESPLWLSIALRYILQLNQSDFDNAADIAQQKRGSFDLGLITYIDEKIHSFPICEKELFTDYLCSLRNAYGELPYKLFLLLSASYNGLDESIIAALIGKDWDIRTFAIVRSYLKGYVAEQSQLRNWQLMHKKLLLRLSEEEMSEVCAQISDLYMKRLQVGQTINDNLCYYLICGRRTENGLAYLLHSSDANYEQHVFDELCQVSDVISTDKLLQFLFDTYGHRKDGIYKWFPAGIMINPIKNAIVFVVQYAIKNGDYDKALQIIDAFHDFLFNLRISYDLKLLYYMVTIQRKMEIIERTGNKEDQSAACQDALNHLKIRGPLSLLLVPIGRRFYKWQLYNLK